MRKMITRLAFLLTVYFFVFPMISVYALDKITIDYAEIRAGNLFIVGNSLPNESIYMDEISYGTTNPNGDFIIRAREIPASCVSVVKILRVERKVPIANCVPQGLPGRDGANGLSGYQSQKKACRTDQLESGFCVAVCPEKTVLLGGACTGGEYASSNGPLKLPAQPWRYRCRGYASGDKKVTAYAFCASINSDSLPQ